MFIALNLKLIRKLLMSSYGNNYFFMYIKIDRFIPSSEQSINTDSFFPISEEPYWASWIPGEGQYLCRKAAKTFSSSQNSSSVRRKQ